MSKRKARYTLGFILDRTGRYVLLVHKKSPEWQRGKLNGVGGKVEQGESLIDCIGRETREEACLSIKPASWVPIGTIKHQRESQKKGEVAVFATQFTGDRRRARKGDHERVGWCKIDTLPNNVLSNVLWLVLIARDKLLNSDTSFVSVTAHYK